MVEPSENLQKIFDKALDVTKKLNHEYLTLEHLLFSMLCEEDFSNIVSGFNQVDPDFMKKNVENFLKTKCNDLLMTDVANLPKKWKPKKTQAVERVLNRAFTQVLFSGRNSIEVTDVFLSMFNEKKSWALYFINEVGIEKEKFADYLNNELEANYEDEEMQGMANRALRSFTTNLNIDAETGKIDPVIGRSEELENIALAIGRRQKNNVLLVGEPGVGKTAIAE